MPDASPDRAPTEAPWLHIVGIGEDGLAGLTPASRAIVEAADVLIGGDRHHRLSENTKAERIAWPSPFDASIEVIRSHRGRRVAVLVTGDPLWFSVGARISRVIPAEEIVFHPHLSAFQLAASRLGWSLADVETLTAHGRPVAQIVPCFRPDARLIVLTTGGATPVAAARLLAERGYGGSRLTVFGAMGGDRESRRDGIAGDWCESPPDDLPDFNTLAIECAAGPDALIAPRVPGLDDDLFRHDGQITKREVRAATLARLMPMRGGILWDIGAGCGSVGIEWMRAAPDAVAYGVEPNDDRRALAAENAVTLGAPRFELRNGRAPAALDAFPSPDAVFVGGGLSMGVVEKCHAALKPFGRLVANAVTVESEEVLYRCRETFGGDLTRLSVQRAAPVGRLTGWRPMMPVTQWALVKR